MAKFFWAAVCFILIAGFVPVPSFADDTGMASIHELRRERGKLCMASHRHYGSGESSRSKSRARRAAIASWQDFTGWEYGSDWARFGNAAGKTIGCSRAGGVYSCQVSGRPCKRRGRRRRG